MREGTHVGPLNGVQAGGASDMEEVARGLTESLLENSDGDIGGSGRMRGRQGGASADATPEEEYAGVEEPDEGIGEAMRLACAMPGK